MIKKVLGLWIVLVMLFSLTACNTDIDLMSYKTDSKVAIQSYADSRQEDFSSDNWTIVCNIVIEGKKAVDSAESKTDVNIVIKHIKNAIEEVGINRDDGLNYEIRSEIINWSYLYLDLGQNNGITQEDIDSWWIDYYYGQYNGFHIFHFRVWGFGIELETIIDNLSFMSRGTLEIFAVKENCGMTLKELYYDGHITRADLEEIYLIHSN